MWSSDLINVFHVKATLTLAISQGNVTMPAGKSKKKRVKKEVIEAEEHGEGERAPAAAPPARLLCFTEQHLFCSALLQWGSR